MVTVDIAGTDEDFRSAAGFFHDLAVWDAQQSEAYGVAAKFIMELFHTHDPDPTAKYRAADARLFIARADGVPAGCVAFDAFDAGALELHRLFVDPAARGQGIGRALLQAALAAAAPTGRSRMLLQTATFMHGAIGLYTALGFLPCPRFRPSPPAVEHLDVFLSRPL